MSKPRTSRLEWGISWALIGVVALMPFHAFLSVWLGSLTGHENIIQAWKEIVTILLALATGILVYLEPERLKVLKRTIVLPAAIFVALAAIITAWHNPGLSAVLYGIKTDFELMLLFFIALLAFPKAFISKLTPIILITGGIVAVIAIALVTILPVDTLTIFGYSHTTIEPYAYVGAAHNLIRTPSTLGGPNQLGSFLILPLCLLLGIAMKRRAWWQLGLGIFLMAALYATYSRSAWIGAIIALLATAVATANTRRLGWTIMGISAIAASFSVLSLAVFGLKSRTIQNFIFHATSDLSANANSTAQHSVALSTGIGTVLHHPLGLGLGSAGPASFHSANGLIPENYYLQLAIETGLLGALAFIMFCIGVGWQLWQNRDRLNPAPAIFGALIGISVINLFLHGWADSSTAFIFWIFAGAVLSGAEHVETN